MTVRPAPRRDAFTLVELLVVFVIIAVLAGLLLPVVTGAIRRTKEAAVTAEFQILQTKLEAFRVKYGEYPPSRIILPEDGAWNTADATMIPSTVSDGGDITYGQLATRTLYYLRKYWPGIPVSTTAVPLFDGTGTWYDFDGDGVFDAPTVAGRGKILDGTEALVFWLGGIPLNTGTSADPQLSLSGFARKPFPYPGLGRSLPHPFRNNLENGNRAFAADRDPLFHEFAVQRLVDSDGDGFLEFLDSLGTNKPIVYFRAEGGGGYDPNDVNIPEPDTTGAVTAVARKFRVGYITVAGKDNTIREAISPGPNPYTTGPANTGTTTAWHRPDSYQIISPGADGLYGTGGRYNPSQTAEATGGKLPLEGGTVNLNTTDPGVRLVEKDNLTSFASGPLD